MEKIYFLEPDFVFTALVSYRTELLIISLNPGSGEKDFQGEDIQSLKVEIFLLPNKIDTSS